MLSQKQTKILHLPKVNSNNYHYSVFNMKNLGYIILAAFLAISNIACESDATLDETRVADITAPTVSLKTVTVDKFNAIFEVSLDATGDPATREYGVLISTESQPDMTNSTILAADITQNIASISATLAPGTTYYTCAYALTANQFITSEVKTFTTEEHYLGAFLGKHTLSGYNLSIEGSPVVPIEIEIVADDTNEKVAYLKGLSSFAGVELVLDPVTLIFDLEKGTVTIPDKQLINEPNYGPYQYCMMNLETGTFEFGDNVGIIQENTINFNTLIAVIVDGGNAGVPHFAYANITIK